MLAFVARRLVAESVVLLLAERDPGRLKGLAGVPELRLDRLRHGAARQLLATAVAAPLDEHVRARVLAEARGNPLAVLESPRGLSPAMLAGGFGLPGNASVPATIEASFRRRVAATAGCNPARAARGGGRSAASLLCSSGRRRSSGSLRVRGPS